MVKIRKTKLGLIISLVLISLALFAVPVFAYSYSGYHWNAPSATYDVQNISNAAWRTAINNAASTWNNAGADFTFVNDTSSANDWLTSNWGNGALMLAQPSGSPYITGCYTWINTYHSWYTDGSQYDVETVALHEFGHWLKLNDLTNPWDCFAVMYQEYNGEQRSLNFDDVNGINAIY